LYTVNGNTYKKGFATSNSLKNSEVKDLVGTRTKKETKETLESDRKTRSQKTSSTINLRSRTKWS
jgi:hypothetical protein